MCDDSVKGGVDASMVGVVDVCEKIAARGERSGVPSVGD